MKNDILHIIRVGGVKNTKRGNFELNHQNTSYASIIFFSEHNLSLFIS